MKTSSKYRIHRTIAIIVVPLLILSTATGFFRANQKWYWEEGYKKKKTAQNFSPDQELVSVNSVIKNIDSVSGKENKFEEIIIRSEDENVYFLATTKSKDKYLVDALSGKIVSPISNEMAAGFAAQYVKDKPKVKTCELLTDYIPRKGKAPKATYKVAFDNAVHSEVYLDSQSGEIVEDIDDNRKFGIWMIRLHEYDFFNSKRGITSFVGIIIFLLALSGLWIYRIRKKKAGASGV